MTKLCPHSLLICSSPLYSLKTPEERKYFRCKPNGLENRRTIFCRSSFHRWWCVHVPLCLHIEKFCVSHSCAERLPIVYQVRHFIVCVFCFFAIECVFVFSSSIESSTCSGFLRVSSASVVIGSRFGRKFQLLVVCLCVLFVRND